MQIRRSRTKQNTAKQRAKEREKKYCRPASPEMFAEPSVSLRHTSKVVHELTDSAIDFWDKLYEQHQDETHSKWEQEQQQRRRSSSTSSTNSYMSFKDAVLGRRIQPTQPTPTGAVLYAKKRKLQRLVMPKIMYSTIDLSSPRERRESRVDDSTSDEDAPSENVQVGVPETEDEQPLSLDEEYVLVDDEDDYDFVDDFIRPTEGEKEKGD